MVACTSMGNIPEDQVDEEDEGGDDDGEEGEKVEIVPIGNKSVAVAAERMGGAALLTASTSFTETSRIGWFLLFRWGFLGCPDDFFRDFVDVFPVPPMSCVCVLCFHFSSVFFERFFLLRFVNFFSHFQAATSSGASWCFLVDAWLLPLALTSFRTDL